jgi:hypothetical protein
MPPVVRGLVLAFGLFALSFALHIVGGATDQGWLFAIAVCLIFITAVGFPVIASALSSGTKGARRMTFIAGFPIGIVLTTSALWAANGRSVAWWELPAGALLVAAFAWGWRALTRRGGGLRAAPSRAR